MTGCGPFVHDDPRDRPGSVFAGRVALITGDPHENWLLGTVRPAKMTARLLRGFAGCCRYGGMNDPPFTSRATPVM